MLIFKPIIDKTRKFLDITKDGSIVVPYRALLLKNSIYRTLENQKKKKKKGKGKNKLKGYKPRTEKNVF